MKKLASCLFVLSTTALLSACGGDKDGNANTSTLASTVGPQVAIPGIAHVSDYECVETREFVDPNGAPRRAEDKYSGKVSLWKENGYTLSWDEESTGDQKIFSRYQKVSLEEGKYRTTGSATFWRLADGAWSKRESAYVRLWQKQGNLRRVLENEENGVRGAPYYWEFETVDLDFSTSRTTQRHLKPEVRDRDGFHYTRIEVVCTDKDRK